MIASSALKPGVEGSVDLDPDESKEKQDTEKDAREEVKEKKEEDDR